VLIVGATLAGVALLVGIFVGAIILFALYSFGTSDAAATAKEFLRNNERLKQEIGQVKDFGTLVSQNISVNRGYGTATLSLKVIGEKATVNATVDLVYASGKPWRVTSAAYENEDGKMIDLLNPYETLVSNICRGGPPKKPQRLIWVKFGVVS